MRRTVKRSRPRQLTLFQLQTATPCWEDLPAPTRAELVRLIARLLERLQPPLGDRAEGANHE
jgi:hypothetical protein